MNSMPGVTPNTNPPRSLEHLLLLLLPARNRDAVAGDLHEAYAEHLQRSGPTRASLWYAQQVLSFAPGAVLAGVSRARVLTLLCSFTALCGLWLGLMNIVLHHPAWQEFISGTIVGQALLTLAALTLYRSRLMRGLALIGCLGIGALGGWAIWGMLHGPDMEGYIFLIGLLLILQALLTLRRFTHNLTVPALPS